MTRPPQSPVPDALRNLTVGVAVGLSALLLSSIVFVQVVVETTSAGWLDSPSVRQRLLAMAVVQKSWAWLFVPLALTVMSKHLAWIRWWSAVLAAATAEGLGWAVRLVAHGTEQSSSRDGLDKALSVVAVTVCAMLGGWGVARARRQVTTVGEAAVPKSDPSGGEK